MGFLALYPCFCVFYATVFKKLTSQTLKRAVCMMTIEQAHHNFPLRAIESMLLNEWPTFREDDAQLEKKSKVRNDLALFLNSN